jgi:hypothetical protein
MRFEHGFKLLTCVVLFSAGMFAGGSEAETITFSGYASAGPMDSMIADQPALLQPDRPAIKSANPEAVDSGGFNPVPEPASMLLVGSGLIVLAGVGRRKFFKKKSRNGKASYSQLTAHTDQ